VRIKIVSSTSRHAPTTDCL